MKTLLILRHATAAAHGHDGTDQGRPLTALGRDEAHIQGNFLCEAGYQPLHIIASTALRAWETAETVAGVLGRPGNVELLEGLYEASGTALLQCVHDLPDSADTALLVGHMPGVAELADLLLADDRGPGTAVQPGTLLALSLPKALHWREAEPGTAQLDWCLPPLLVQQAV